MLLGGRRLVLLDTAPGHRFIVDRIGQVETATGLASASAGSKARSSARRGCRNVAGRAIRRACS